MESRIKAELRTANEQCITMLSDTVRPADDPASELLGKLAPQLQTLDAHAFSRLADRPYLLVDFRFQDAAWWRAVHEGTAAASDTHFWRGHPRAVAVELAQRTLTLAWHCVELRRAAAILNLGIAPSVADTLRHLPLQELNRLAELHVHALTPRWLNRPLMWSRLLDAAKEGNAESLRFVDRLGAQLLAADLLDDPA